MTEDGRSGTGPAYEFVDRWKVDAPIEAVFDALADARTYPRWWTPVYIEVDADGPPRVGCASRQRFRGKLPYTLRQTSTVVRLEPPYEIRAAPAAGLSASRAQPDDPTAAEVSLPRRAPDRRPLRGPL